MPIRLALACLAIAASLASCTTPNPVDLNFPVLALEPLKTPVPKPTKVIGMMFNYPREDGATQPSPAFFVRAVNALASHGDVLPIPEPALFDSVLYEGELVLVIGKRASKVTIEEARACILGYTCGMDGSPVALDAQGERDVARSIAGKSADGVAPVGPWVVSDIDPGAQTIELRVNGEVVEKRAARTLIWGPARIVSEISRTVTLEPGDLIFSGAARALPKFSPGDWVEVEITDIGILSNHIEGVREEPAPAR